MGAMTTPGQIYTVTEQIRDALDKGAVIYAQSGIPDGRNGKNFLPATVLTNVSHDMLVMQCETFGPVVAVMKVNDMAEAIKLANDSELGLTASVWSRNRQRAEQIARQIQAGVVNINDHLISHGMPETPWGGFKQSGLGRTHGQIGFDEMTQPQVIIKDIMPLAKRNLWWPPNNADVYNGIKGLIDFSYSHKLSRRINGIRRLLKILPRWFKEE